MRRKEERECLLQMLYQMSIKKDFSDTEMKKFIEYYIKDVKNLNFFTRAYQAVRDNLEEIDNLINQYSKSWNSARMPKVDLSILRLSLAEILYLDDVPQSVSINEAVELAKQYSTEESGKFVNGVLGSIVAERNGGEK